jgi:hypothetical protein
MKTFIKLLLIIVMTALIGVCSTQAQSFHRKKISKRIAKVQKKHLKRHGEVSGCNLIPNPIEQAFHYSAHRNKQRKLNRGRKYA